MTTVLRKQGPLNAAKVDDLEAETRAQGAEMAKKMAHLVRMIEEGTEEKSWLAYAAGLRALVVSWPDGIHHKEGMPRKPPRKKDRDDLAFLDEAVVEVVEPFKKALEKSGWNREHWEAMAQEWAEFGLLATDFSNRLAAMKEDQARFEMDDLELKTLEILRGQPFLASVFADSWDYWMIDEYQDTSPLQVEVLGALIGERKRYLVGDPQQSIYLFRGAEAGVFRAAEREIVASGGHTRVLNTNYRSRPELLAFINDFMPSVIGEFVRMIPWER